MLEMMQGYGAGVDSTPRRIFQTLVLLVETAAIVCIHLKYTCILVVGKYLNFTITVS